MAQTADETLIFMFPGQGAQEAKMFKDVYQEYGECRKIWKTASEIFGEDLIDICMNRPFKEMQRTDRAQILINTCNIIMFELIRKQGILPDYVMGHSAGELTALYASGAVELEDALYLVACRGKYMYEAATKYRGKMIAVMNVGFEDVKKELETYQSYGIISIGNYNSNSQFVITGDYETVTGYENRMREIYGARVVDLKQQGAWHSRHMDEAREKFGKSISKVNFKKPQIPIMLNYSAESVSDVDQLRYQLSNILTSTVNWYPLLETFISKPSPVFVEVGPNKILRGLLRSSYQHLGVKDYTVMNVNDCFSYKKFLKMTESREKAVNEHEILV
nr:ACP S-malonyltransferase [uncultured Desulfobacter sp.]